MAQCVEDINRQLGTLLLSQQQQQGVFPDAENVLAINGLGIWTQRIPMAQQQFKHQQQQQQLPVRFNPQTPMPAVTQHASMAASTIALRVPSYLAELQAKPASPPVVRKKRYAPLAIRGFMNSHEHVLPSAAATKDYMAAHGLVGSGNNLAHIADQTQPLMDCGHREFIGSNWLATAEREHVGSDSCSERNATLENTSSRLMPVVHKRPPPPAPPLPPFLPASKPAVKAPASKPYGPGFLHPAVPHAPDLPLPAATQIDLVSQPINRSQALTPPALSLRQAGPDQIQRFCSSLPSSVAAHTPAALRANGSSTSAKVEAEGKAATDAYSELDKKPATLPRSFAISGDNTANNYSTPSVCPTCSVGRAAALATARLTPADNQHDQAQAQDRDRDRDRDRDQAQAQTRDRDQAQTQDRDQAQAQAQPRAPRSIRSVMELARMFDRPN
ncbi:hypothetical protein GGF37_001776 [Kickxella alabastrina]|nr:hypothetical protein GGF37_001776 [Kickxella alabastrina]